MLSETTTKPKYFRQSKFIKIKNQRRVRGRRVNAEIASLY
jgi:hypothetical protein